MAKIRSLKQGNEEKKESIHTFTADETWNVLTTTKSILIELNIDRKNMFLGNVNIIADGSIVHTLTNDTWTEKIIIGCDSSLDVQTSSLQGEVIVSCSYSNEEAIKISNEQSLTYGPFQEDKVLKISLSGLQAENTSVIGKIDGKHCFGEHQIKKGIQKEVTLKAGSMFELDVLNQNYDFENMTATGETYALEDTGATEFCFANNGYKLYTCTSAGLVKQYELLEPYKISTMSYTQHYSIGDTNIYGFQVDNDGEYFYINDVIYQRSYLLKYELSEAFNIETASRKVLPQMTDYDNARGILEYSNKTRIIYLARSGDGYIYSKLNNDTYEIRLGELDYSDFFYSTINAKLEAIFFDNTQKRFFVFDQYYSKILYTNLSNENDLSEKFSGDFYQLTLNSTSYRIECNVNGSKLFSLESDGILVEYDISKQMSGNVYVEVK